MSHEAWLLVTAGQGPAECARAAALVVAAIVEDCRARGIALRELEVEPGSERDTVQSAVLGLSADEPLGEFLATWTGTIQVIARSTFRPAHRRKNWFVGVSSYEPVEATRFRPSEVVVETMRSSGAGGQHVNTTESAVRVTHAPTGVQASASEERSQHRNRALALARLQAKLADLDAGREGEARRSRWQAHRSLERGRAVRVLKG